MKTIRHAAWAGHFYPEQPDALRGMIKTFLEQAPAPQPGQHLFGLIVPHAGYVFSGATAAIGYAQIRTQPIDTVVVIAPSHSSFLSGVSVYEGDAYQTPLGEIAIDRERSLRLVETSSLLRLSSDGHRVGGEDAEHSLEVQLPFLQMVLHQPFKLIAAVFHDYSWPICRALGSGLAAIADERTLIIASTDLYHGYSYEECLEADKQTLGGMVAGDAESFCRGYAARKYEACGAGPVAALLQAAAQKKAAKIELLHHTTSADVTGKKGGYVVGYGSLAIRSGI